jgi:cystathionine beta-synthase
MPSAASRELKLDSLPALANGTLDLIGNTPLVEVTHLDAGRCRLFAKLESQNPGGSIKDRPALRMIEAAEADGRLQPGGVIVEATAGNTGLGLALVATLKGYHLILVIPDKMSREKVSTLRALGAEIVLTRSDVGKGHPDYYQDKALQITKDTPGAFFVDQFSNPVNPLTHEQWTAPEIWEQSGHKVDAVVAGIGSGGTLSGIARFFKRVAPQVEIVLADPAGSVLADVVEGKQPAKEPGSWLVEGIGEDFVPPNADLSLVDRAYRVTDAEGVAAARELFRAEALLAGSSTGTILAAALRYAREQETPKNVVFLVPDTGNKYLSKLYSDEWVRDQGLAHVTAYGDIRDLIARPAAEGTTVVVAPDDTLEVAYQRLKLYDLSQLPVVEGGHVVGILDESDLLSAVLGAAEAFSHPVSVAMTRSVETVSQAASIDDLIDVFHRDHVVVVVDDAEQLLGVITRIDLLNYLRRKVA